MQKQQFRSIRRIGKAFFYSLDGLRHAASQEAAFQQELILIVILSLAAMVLPFGVNLKVQLLLVNIAVLIVELLNSSIEVLADKVCKDIDPLIKQAKDMASAAVLLTIFAAILSWCYALYTLFA